MQMRYRLAQQRWIFGDITFMLFMYLCVWNQYSTVNETGLNKEQVQEF
jgi:hypothetical protein